jgi:hypothetical protein
VGLPIPKQAEDVCMSENTECFRNFGIRLLQEKVFRYPHFCNFDAEESIDRIREDDGNPYINLKMNQDLEDLLGSTNELFPLPDLRTRKTNSEVIYMNKSRFNPNRGDMDTFIDSSSRSLGTNSCGFLLIVSPPLCLAKVLKCMKSKEVSKDFLKRVHQIKEEEQLSP